MDHHDYHVSPTELLMPALLKHHSNFPPQVPKVQKKIVNIPVEIITEKIVEVPKIIKEEEIIERKIESTVVKPVFVEVPQVQERIFQQPGEGWGVVSS
jgi:hypothetical protein